jgi:UDPglucose--hexose-1-phosphate uridylyltransferase
VSELRRDPVTGRLVVIAPERRLEDTAVVAPAVHRTRALDGDMCPFCEGQEGVAGHEILAWRSYGSQANTPGWQLRVVPNRNPVLRVEGALSHPKTAFFKTFGGLGAHEVIIETPRHDATLSSMDVEEVWRVLWAWRERIRDLKRDTRLKSFIIVKNVGGAAGARLDHPHSQLVALPLVPQHLEEEMEGALQYYRQAEQCVFCEKAEQEVAAKERIIVADKDAIAFAPFASRVPFETWVMPRAHCAAFDVCADDELRAVAQSLREVMQRLYATLVSPPFTLLLHTASVGNEASESFHWHIEIIPRLAPVTGLEWDGGLHVNTVAPEEAAAALRSAALKDSASLRPSTMLGMP